MGVLDAPGLTRKTGSAFFSARNLTPNSLVRSMVNATVSTDAPTITFSAAATLPYSSLENTTAGWPNLGFRASGAPLFTFSTDHLTTYPRDAAHLDGTGDHVWSGSYRIEFDVDDTAFEFKSTIQANSYYRVWVNEQPHAATVQPMTSIPGGTGAGWIKVAFKNRAYRRIVLELEGNAPTPFNGLRKNTTGTILPPSNPSPRFMWLGDSYGIGLGATYRANAFPILLGRLLGFSDVWNFTSVSSTGILKPQTTGTSPIGDYRTRLATDVIPYAPDVLVIAGSINDTGGAYTGLLGPELDSILTLLQAALPNTQILCTSTLRAYATQSVDTTVNTEIKPIALAHGLPFIDLTDAPYFTGSGSIVNPVGDGNADIYRAADGVHPSDAGHVALAYLLAPRIAKALGGTIGDSPAVNQNVVNNPNSFWKPTAAITETCTRLQRISAIPIISGRLYVNGGAVVPANKAVSGITFVTSTTAAASPTNQWFAILDQNLNVLAKTVDDGTTAWAANAAKTLIFQTTLSAALSTGAAITSLPVAAITNAIAPGTKITVGTGGTTQTFLTAAPASIGDTAITVQSQTPSSAFASGSPVTTPWTPTAATAVYLGLCVVATTMPTLQGPESTATGNGASSLAPVIAGVSTTGLTGPASLGSTGAAVTASNMLYGYLS